ncbi:MAG: winged helix-turn-helix domain-containing protein, partial [Pseudolabrys sp.]
MHPQNVNWLIEAARRLAYSFGLRGLSRDVQFVFDNHTLDTDRRQLRCNSDSIAVQPQVFDLLVYLVQNRDRVVSKNDLIASVWGGRMVSESALTSRINAARKAVGDSGKDQRIIRTSARKGLRFVGAGQVQPAGDEIAPVVKQPPDEKREETPLALPLPERPAIAVLPFTNMSGDPEQEYFSDGISGDMITALSKLRWFFVIARSSSFTYKGKAVHLRQIAEELGVGYVLEGSVRKAASRVRVTAQLIDASKGVHLWADRYDRELANIFELQDEITNKVIDSVGPQIIVAEAARVRRKPPQNIDAWDLVMQALPHMWHMSTEEQRHAQDLLQQAIALDPEYAHAHALLGWTYVNMFNLDSGTPIGEFTDQALDAGERAVTLDEQDHWGHLVLGLGHARRRRPETAVMHLSQAVELNPNFALGYAGLGYAFACGGQPERGLEALEQAQRLSPRDPFLAIYAPVVRYMALFALQRYE